MDETKVEAPKTLIRALRDHFGYRQGRDLKDFSEEVKALSPGDRADFVKYFAFIGVPVVDPQAEQIAA